MIKPLNQLPHSQHRADVSKVYHKSIADVGPRPSAVLNPRQSRLNPSDTPENPRAGLMAQTGLGG